MGLLVLYWVIRLAVRHGIRDSHFVFHVPPPPPRLPAAYLVQPGETQPGGTPARETQPRETPVDE